MIQPKNDEKNYKKTDQEPTLAWAVSRESVALDFLYV